MGKAKTPIRSVRLTEKQIEMLAKIEYLDRNKSGTHLLPPRKEGTILSAAIEIGLDTILRAMQEKA